MKHNIKEIVERFEERQRRQEYLSTGVCMKCGRKEDHYKPNKDGWIFTHQFESPNANDLMTDRDYFIQSHIDMLDDLVEEIIDSKELETIIDRSGRGSTNVKAVIRNEAKQETITHLQKRKEELKELIK